MYKIIGANQAEYGPVSGEQLRQWIAEGRINAQTPCQPVGDNTWRPISSIPEFASSFPGQAVPPAGAAPTPQAPPPSYAAPSQSPQSDAGRARAQSEVSGPAIGLMITAGLGIAAALLGILSVVLGIDINRYNRTPHFRGETPEMRRLMQMTQPGPGTIAGDMIRIAVGAFVLFAAMKMKNLESHGLAIAASILSIIPCCSPCCCIGIPLGIWALVVLNKSDVKDYFSS